MTDTVAGIKYIYEYDSLGQGWIRAKDLKSGDIILLLDGTQARIESVVFEQLDKPVKVFNFEVEDFHTYFVGHDGWLVHNVGCFTECQDAVLRLASEYYHSGGRITNGEAWSLWYDALDAGFYTGGRFHQPQYDSFHYGYHMKINGMHILAEDH